MIETGLLFLFIGLWIFYGFGVAILGTGASMLAAGIILSALSALTYKRRK